MQDVEKRTCARHRRVRAAVLLVVVALALAAVTALLLLFVQHTVAAAALQSPHTHHDTRARDVPTRHPPSSHPPPQPPAEGATKNEEAAEAEKGSHGGGRARRDGVAGDGDAAVTTAADYQPAMAWIGLHYCKAAYCPTAMLANWSCGPACAQRNRFDLFRITSNESKGTAGFTGVDHALGAIVVAYRGSYNTANWIEDLSYWATPYPTAACGVACAVHRGFYHAYLSVREEVLCDVAALHARYPDYTLLLTGHSLGAAMALLTALDVAVHDDDVAAVTTCRSSHRLAAVPSSLPRVATAAADVHTHSDDTSSSSSSSSATTTANTTRRRGRSSRTAAPLPPLSAVPMAVYTYGEPRVGNAAFTRWATSMLNSSSSSNNSNSSGGGGGGGGGNTTAPLLRQRHRITHARDVVPHLPPRSSGYTHVPHELWYSNKTGSHRPRNHHNRSRKGDNDDDDAHDDAGGVYRSCDDDATHEDVACSEGMWATSIADHLVYLGVCTRCVCTAAEAREAASYTLSARVRAELWADYVTHHGGSNATPNTATAHGDKRRHHRRRRRWWWWRRGVPRSSHTRTHRLV